MKGLIILAPLFEDVEAIATIDILRRANINVDVVSLIDYEVPTSSGLNVRNTYCLKDINYQDYDFLVLPGGKATFKYLHVSETIDKIIEFFYNNHRLIAAICAAPGLIGKHGFLNNYTIFPGCGEMIVSGKLVNEPVVFDNNIITARSMYYSQDFALKIVEVLKGIETRNVIESQIKGL